MLDEDIPTVVPYIAELVDGKHISAYALCTILDFVAHTIIVVLPQGAKIDVLLYNGDLDLSCNPQSTELALESMEWSGKEEWMDPEKTPWQQWMIGKKKTYPIYVLHSRLHSSLYKSIPLSSVSKR